MKILLYNIAYGSGTPGNLAQRIAKAHRYLQRPEKKFCNICEFIKTTAPDVAGLLEIDGGSRRSKSGSQVSQIADILGHYPFGCVKYSENFTFWNLPFFKHQQNALFLREKPERSYFHFLKIGLKRLVIESEYQGVKIFLVHLSVRRNVRRRQIEELQVLIKKHAPPPQPCVLMGDFNTFRGAKELHKLCKELDLQSANKDNLPSFPALKEKRQLDYILYSPGLKLKRFEIVKHAFSDHLPLVAEFEKAVF